LHSRASVSGSASAWAFGRGRDARAILKAYPYLESADIGETLRYAASLAEDETIELAPSN
jgi:uncharacterized protein (DUF433 family)